MAVDKTIAALRSIVMDCVVMPNAVIECTCDMTTRMIVLVVMSVSGVAVVGFLMHCTRVTCQMTGGSIATTVVAMPRGASGHGYSVEHQQDGCYEAI